MEDSVITVIAILLAVILMFIFPIMSVSDRLDDITQLSVQSEVTKFVDKVRQKGSITDDDYYNFRKVASSNGSLPLQIEIQIQILDENPNIKTAQSEKTKIGENLYYNLYTTQIESKLGTDGKIVLKEGDMISVNVKNRNKTMSQILRQVFMHTSEQTYQISASHSGLVIVDGN